MKYKGWLTTLVLLLASATAAAQDSPSQEVKAEASAHFRQGVELFQEGAYRAALVEFRKAYEVLPDYRVRYNIAQTHLALGNYLQAHEDFERYLEKGAGEVPRERRAEVERQLEGLQNRVGQISIAVNVPDAEVSVDGETVGKTPLDRNVRVNVGPHRVLARGPSGATATQTVEVAGGELVELELEIEPRKTTAVSPPPNPFPHDRGGLSTKQKWAVGGFALTGGLAIGAGVVGGLALKTQGDLDDELDGLVTDPESVQDKNDEVERLSLVGDVLLGASVAFGITSLVLLLVGDDEPEEQQSPVALEVGPTTVRATARF